MNNDALDVGIQIYEAQGGPPRGGPPGELYLKARVDGGQDEGAYEAIAETILTLAEKYKQQIYFDQLHVVLVAEGGRVAYDHTFQVAPPSSTTSTTQAFIIYYSGPSLDVSPRRGVTLKATISQYSSGAIFANVEIRNDSGSAFQFLSEDLQLYVDGTRVEQTNADLRPMEVTGGVVTQIYFNPSAFDPHLAGLVYTSSDPQSQGFTASDGPTQAQAPK